MDKIWKKYLEAVKAGEAKSFVTWSKSHVTKDGFFILEAFE